MADEREAERTRVLIVDDEPLIAEGYKKLLTRKGYSVVTASSAEEAIDIITSKSFDVVVTDLKMPGMDGLELTSFIKNHQRDAVVIVITAYGTIETAVKAVVLGAYDYLCKPFSNEQFLISVVRAREFGRLLKENRRLKREIERQNIRKMIVGRDPKMAKIIETIDIVARSDASVLIQGESGTGKELIAQRIHELSPRKEWEFIAIDCAALPSTLLESELFGYEKGAFTGAVSTKKGLLEVADGGTIFLDEIGEMSFEMQTALLRFLEERKIRRLGGTKSIDVDIRVITATNKKLDELIRKGLFREDLYYRLNVFMIEIPPLRERKGDIPLLADFFVKEFSRLQGKRSPRLSEEVLNRFFDYYWPGNIRELRNIIQHAVLLCAGDTIEKEHLPPNFMKRMETEAVSYDEIRDDLPYFDAKREFLKGFERRYFERLLTRFGYHLGRTAEYAGIDRKSLRNIMKRVNLKK